MGSPQQQVRVPGCIESRRGVRRNADRLAVKRAVRAGCERTRGVHRRRRRAQGKQRVEQWRQRRDAQAQSCHIAGRVNCTPGGELPETIGHPCQWLGARSAHALFEPADDFAS